VYRTGCLTHDPTLVYMVLEFGALGDDNWLDLARVARVCRLWRAIVTHHPPLVDRLQQRFATWSKSLAYRIGAGMRQHMMTGCVVDAPHCVSFCVSDYHVYRDRTTLFVFSHPFAFSLQSIEFTCVRNAPHDVHAVALDYTVRRVPRIAANVLRPRAEWTEDVDIAHDTLHLCSDTGGSGSANGGRLCQLIVHRVAATQPIVVAIKGSVNCTVECTLQIEIETIDHPMLSD